MITIDTASEARSVCARWRAEGDTLAFVPTMGALHEGHLSLVRIAHDRCDRVAVSIFVNPRQFGPQEDYSRYPRPLEQDSMLLSDAGVDLLFAPPPAEMYPEGFSTTLSVAGPSQGLCGSFRPGHFDGVATVCCVLFGIIGPHVSVFGRKDAQQLAVIRRMVRDLGMGMEVVGAPIVREADGLAMSSRNRYLNSAERIEATAIHAGLLDAGLLAASGCRDADRLVGAVKASVCGKPLLRLQYAQLVDPDAMTPMPVLDRRGLIAAAVFAGTTRLIDNALLEPGTGCVEV